MEIKRIRFKMRDVKKGMKFLYRSKYDDSSYIGVVSSVNCNLGNDKNSFFFAESGISYSFDDVEWLDEIRDAKLKELGL